MHTVIHDAAWRFIYISLTLSLAFALAAFLFASSAPVGEIAARTRLAYLLLERALSGVLLTLIGGLSLDLYIKRREGDFRL